MEGTSYRCMHKQTHMHMHNHSLKEGDSGWKVTYTNINGIVSALTELNDYLRERKPDILGLVETKLSDSVEIQGIGEGQYNMWKRNRKGKKGGGVMLLIRKEVTVENVEEGEGMAEVLKVGIRRKKGGIRDFVVVYVPPKTNVWSKTDHDEMLRDTTRSLRKTIEGSENIIVMGDFNCKEVCWEEWSTEGGEESWGGTMLNLVMNNIMTQWIEEKTRFRGSEEPSRLDLLLTKEADIIGKINYRCPLGKSDHILIEFETNEGRDEERKEAHRNGRYNYGKADFEGLRKYFMEEDWSSFDEAICTQEKWDEFLRIYKEGVERHVPKVVMKGKIKRKEWYNRKCELAEKEKEEAWNRWRRKGSHKLWEKYKLARNEYVRIRREEERNYEKNIVEKCKDEPKLFFFYRYVNGKMKTKEGINRLKVDGVVYEDALPQAEVMNKCFQSVFTRESEFEEVDGGSKDTVLEEIQVDIQEVKKIMESQDVSKAPGPDGVSNWIMKECSNQLAGKIHSIIVSSLNESKVPLDWKKANIVPIHKGGDKEEPLNYRPVSLTSVVAKICERIVKDRWMRYLEETSSLSECQFGFRRGRSCTMNLLSFYSRVIDVTQERDGWADCVYLDLKKAFDKVPHRRLLWKLEHVGGLKGGLLKWMEDYLRDREMRTVIKDQKSEWCRVISGVPQGSVLAPVMFLVYMNDMVEGVNSYVSLFADDAKLLRKVKTIADCESLQRDLDKILEWSERWEMKFNAKKCSDGNGQK